MSDHDLSRVDAYATHLGKVNETKEVIASEDILNELGVILVKKGMQISAQIAQRILSFKLTRPLHDSVKIEDEITGTILQKSIFKFVEQDPNFNRIHEHYDIKEFIISGCRSYDQIPLLRQKMTVLSIRMPKLYQQTLYCTWFCTLVAVQLSLSKSEIETLFLAAISHDFGSLHISPEIMDKKGALTPEEWKQMQAHVLIGQKMLSEMKALPKETARAVLEHHEYCDGTGYPAGRFDNELKKIGQIISMSDSIISIYGKKLEPAGRSLRDMIPIIQINKAAHFYPIYEAAVTILRRSKFSEASNVQSNKIVDFVDKFVADENNLQDHISVYKKILAALSPGDSDNTNTLQTRKIHRVYHETIIAITGSGVLNEGYLAWVVQVKKEAIESAYREVEDAALMVSELFYHLQKLNRLLSLYSDSKHCDQSTRQAVQEGLKDIKNLGKGSMAS